jgi:hypothetical protein
MLSIGYGELESRMLFGVQGPREDVLDLLPFCRQESVGRVNTNREGTRTTNRSNRLSSNELWAFLEGNQANLLLHLHRRFEGKTARRAAAPDCQPRI